VLEHVKSTSTKSTSPSKFEEEKDKKTFLDDLLNDEIINDNGDEEEDPCIALRK
jgi:hypothetical protein